MLRPTPSKRLKIFRALLGLALLSAAVLLGGWLGWYEAERRLKEAFAGQYERMTALETSLASEVAARQVVQQQLIVEQSTRSMLGSELAQAQAEIASQQEALLFFDSLLTSNDRARAVRLVACELQAVDARRYRYRALLAQGLNRDEEYQGRLIVAVDYTLKGKRGRVSVGEEKPVTVQIKHYERIDGVITMPADAQPQALDVRIVSANGQTLAAQCRKKLESRNVQER